VSVGRNTKPLLRTRISTSGLTRFARPRIRTALPAALLLVIIVICVAAPVFAPYNPTEIAPSLQFQAPGRHHVLGTDGLGRDLFSRVLYAGRITILISGSATCLALLGGVVWGTVSAVRGGLAEEVLMRIADVFMAVPLLLFALMLVVVFGANIRGLIAIMALLQAPWIARIIRAVAASELRADYCTAATAFGTSRPRLLTHEILPNLLPTIRTQATLVFAYSILLESTLSFIGLGVQPPDASWGTLLSDGYTNIYQSYYGIIFPGFMIIIVAIALNTLADSYDFDKAL
jgi:peptide/nickel transport system permease protein